MSFRFTSHRELEGAHSFLSASKHHWVNYDEDKLDKTFLTAMAAKRGTEMHAFAAEAIRLKIRLPRTMQTINMYVNDALGFHMSPEVVLFYSVNAFGTADAIGFRDDFLRVHDLKTGTGRTSERQLEIYDAYFCLEYGIRPGDIQIENRIYQNDEVKIFEPDVDDILHIMDRIITFDKRINKIREEILG